MQEENEEQRTGRNKKTAIDRAYIEGGEYRNKFDLLTESKELNRLLYRIAKEILRHRTGTEFEDMYWIDSSSNKVVASITDSTETGKIIYSDTVIKTISKYKGLVTIHSHPSGLPPSVADFNANYENDYSFGIVIGHNGRVFIYSSKEKIDALYFDMKVAQFMGHGYNESEAREKTILYCMERFKIWYKEVNPDEQ